MVSTRSITAVIDIPSYPSAQKLLEAEAGRIFLHLEDKSYTEVAYMFGLDRYLANEASMRSGITRAYNLVLDNPSKYDIPSDKAAYIQGKVTGRGVGRKNPETLRQEKEMKEADIGALITGSRDLVTRLLNRYLEYLDKNPKALKEQKIRDLAWVVGVLFDKGQIVSGLATENIAVMSNLDAKLDPEEALKAILQMREELNLKKQ